MLSGHVLLATTEPSSRLASVINSGVYPAFALLTYCFCALCSNRRHKRSFAAFRRSLSMPPVAISFSNLASAYFMTYSLA